MSWNESILSCPASSEFYSKSFRNPESGSTSKTKVRQFGVKVKVCVLHLYAYEVSNVNEVHFRFMKFLQRCSIRFYFSFLDRNADVDNVDAWQLMRRFLPPVRCLLSCPLCRNDIPQSWHLKGFSPVWIRMWFCNWVLCTNFLPHVSHLGQVSVCSFICFLIKSRLKTLSQTLQGT